MTPGSWHFRRKTLLRAIQRQGRATPRRVLSWSAAILALGSGLSLPQGSSSAQPPVFRLGPNVAAPFVLAKVKPSYTDEARLARLEGSVLLSVVVDADGRPGDIRVERALGLGLDASAIRSVTGWEFRPGTRSGMPVSMRVIEEVFFRRPRGLWDWHVTSAAFALSSSTVRPVVIRTRFPNTVAREENASVTITFEVAQSGVPVNASVVRSSDSRWEKDLLTSLRRGWRFRPGTQNGKPVAVRAWLDFVRGSHSPMPANRFPRAPVND